MNWFVFFAEKIMVNPDKTGIPTNAASGDTMNNLITAVYIAIAGIAVFYIIRGALLYVTGSGNPSEVTQARTTVLMAVVALAASTLVFGVVQFVIGAL